jgi:putative oxidoreductase
MKKLLFGTPVTQPIASMGLLLFRLAFGGFMLIGHGWPKLAAFSSKADSFPDPLGIGPELSMAGAVFCEAACSALVLLGLATRAAVLPLMFTMAVAAFAIHGGGPLFLPAEGAKEPALLYLFAFALLLFTGPGRYSVDRAISL